MVPHGVCQCPDGIVKNEQILVLVLSESKHQRIQDECQVRHQLCAGFLLQRGKCAMMSSRETILGHLWQLIHSVTTESNNEYVCELLRGFCLPASSLLYTLVTIQDTFEQLRHQRLQVCVRRLTDNPVGITTQCPASDGPHQGFFIRQTLDEVGNELRQVWDHALHAAWGRRSDKCQLLPFAILKI